MSSRDIMLSEALSSDPMHAELLEKVSANGALKNKILQRSTSLQVLLLTIKADQLLYFSFGKE